MDGGRPTKEVARWIASEFGGAVARCERFPTGLRNWVYDVALASGQSVVVKLCQPENRAELAGAVAWGELLGQAGVPVAKVLAHDVEAAQPHVVFERLPGTDLGNVFDELSGRELDSIADEVASWQRATQTALAPAAGYGFATSYTSDLHRTWRDLLHAALDRSVHQIRSAAVVDPATTDPVRSWLDRSASPLAAVAPLPFLHDATTKNVIVHRGDAVGLVDVDLMAFGDPLYIAALTRMSLLAAGRPPTYAHRLAEAMADDIELLDLYTAVQCVGFLAELGQRFNQDQPAPVDPDFLARLEAILRQLLA